MIHFGPKEMKNIFAPPKSSQIFIMHCLSFLLVFFLIALIFPSKSFSDDLVMGEAKLLPPDRLVYHPTRYNPIEEGEWGKSYDISLRGKDNEILSEWRVSLTDFREYRFNGNRSYHPVWRKIVTAAKFKNISSKPQKIAGANGDFNLGFTIIPVNEKYGLYTSSLQYEIIHPSGARTPFPRSENFYVAPGEEIEISGFAPTKELNFFTEYVAIDIYPEIDGVGIKELCIKIPPSWIKDFYVLPVINQPWWEF